MLEVQRALPLSCQYHGFLPSFGTFSTQKQVGALKLQDATALRSTSHRPNEASWHQ